MAQLFPILARLVPRESPRALSLYERYKQAQPYDGKATGKGIQAEAAAQMGDRSWLRTFLDAYQRNVADAGHPGCLNADAARVALAAATL